MCCRCSETLRNIWSVFEVRSRWTFIECGKDNTLWLSAHNSFSTKIGPDQIFMRRRNWHLNMHICNPKRSPHPLTNNLTWVSWFAFHVHVAVFGIWPERLLAGDTMSPSNQCLLGSCGYLFTQSFSLVHQPSVLHLMCCFPTSGRTAGNICVFLK